MKIKIIGYIAGSLQIIATIAALLQGWWSYANLLGIIAQISIGVFIILLSTKLKI